MSSFTPNDPATSPSACSDALPPIAEEMCCNFLRVSNNDARLAAGSKFSRIFLSSGLTWMVSSVVDSDEICASWGLPCFLCCFNLFWTRAACNLVFTFCFEGNTFVCFCYFGFAGLTTCLI